MTTIEEQVAALQQQLQQVLARVGNLAAQNEELNARALRADEALNAVRDESARNRAAAQQNGGEAPEAGPLFGGGNPASVSKWAPDSFSGDRKDWRAWSMKFKSYVGAMMRGQIGVWMDGADVNREVVQLSASLADAARGPSAALYHALIATCEHGALNLVERAGTGEGLEAWRLLLRKCEPQTRQTRVLRMIQILNYDFKSGDLVDQLEPLDRLIAIYTRESGKEIDDDTKIGVVIKGMEAGALREHLLLHSERCDSYEEFRNEVDTIAKARAAHLLEPTPMELGAAGKGKGKDGKQPVVCHNCGKVGHKASDCWQRDQKGPGKGRGRGKGRGKSQNAQQPEKRKCFKCGMTNHIAKDCRASEEKKAKYQQKLKATGQNQQSLESGASGAADSSVGNDAQRLTMMQEEPLGGFWRLCELRHRGGIAGSLEAVDSTASHRWDRANRTITFGVDSGACVTAVPTDHLAVRGYRVWSDGQKNRTYTAASGKSIRDEGARVLQTRADGPEGPRRLRTRCAKVRRPLLSVKEIVRVGNRVVFDLEGSYTEDKHSGRRQYFRDVPGGWDLTLDLEAPEVANEVAEQIHSVQQAQPAVALRNERTTLSPPLVTQVGSSSTSSTSPAANQAATGALSRADDVLICGLCGGCGSGDQGGPFRRLGPIL